MKLRPSLFIFMLTFILAAMFAASPSPAATGNTPPEVRSAAKQPFSSISPTEAKSLIDNRKDLVILDVRSPEEVKSEGAIKDAVLVPLMAVMQNKLSIPKEKPLLLVCAVGGRSFAAGQMLVRYGYREVYNLSGGLDAWKKNGLPVVR